ncbi:MULTISPECIES: ATP-grasp peptide maturase system methyltransferase [unclassified Streptomyces]|uniref:ATP-grasp peptide maturase system methyltransferase n=1 Tax=unclassified Streptomyces TaxID=2593676 RepID=UPI002E28FA30|nr:ATP-grasp peptide maturase system methyltransferase [Streptomyces sp. NBC_00223]
MTPSTPDLAAALRRELADKIRDSGSAADPAWLEAVAAVPRELFVDAAYYRYSWPNWQPVRRSEIGDEEWLRRVCSDTTWVTQVDGVDAAEADAARTGSPTSSSTLPSLVVRTLEVAGITDGDRVLEVGTGTGYSTALLCHRLGEKNVTSVEYDPGLAASAAAHLRAAGYAPALVTGDGLLGHQEGAEYDAIVATCSVRYIPRSWLWQVRDGGTITTTLNGWMGASGLIRLTLDEEGVATGRFERDEVSYMLARPHERPPRPAFYRAAGHTRTSSVDPRLLQNWTGLFVAQLAAPSAEFFTAGDDGTVALVDVATGSQAWTEGSEVHQHGPLRLWDQVENALTVWQAAGAPDHTAFGMTVTDEAQTVWLAHPDGPNWPLPA